MYCLACLLFRLGCDCSLWDVSDPVVGGVTSTRDRLLIVASYIPGMSSPRLDQKMNACTRQLGCEAAILTCFDRGLTTSLSALTCPRLSP